MSYRNTRNSISARQEAKLKEICTAVFGVAIIAGAAAMRFTPESSQAPAANPETYSEPQGESGTCKPDEAALITSAEGRVLGYLQP